MICYTGMSVPVAGEGVCLTPCQFQETFPQRTLMKIQCCNKRDKVTCANRYFIQAWLLTGLFNGHVSSVTHRRARARARASSFILSVNRRTVVCWKLTGRILVLFVLLRISARINCCPCSQHYLFPTVFSNICQESVFSSPCISVSISCMPDSALAFCFFSEWSCISVANVFPVSFKNISVSVSVWVPCFFFSSS